MLLKLGLVPELNMTGCNPTIYTSSLGAEYEYANNRIVKQDSSSSEDENWETPKPFYQLLAEKARGSPDPVSPEFQQGGVPRPPSGPAVVETRSP